MFKAYYAPTADLAARLRQLRVPTTDRPSPTPLRSPAHPVLDEDYPAATTTSGRSPRLVDPRVGPALDPDTGAPLRGFAKANAARAALSSNPVATQSKPAPLCPSCGRPIDSGTGECACTW